MSGGRLAGKTAVVTGAGAGLGHAAAVRFAAEGASVVCADMSPAGAKDTAERIRAAGGEAFDEIVDVTERGAMDALAARAVSRWDRIDVLYANAGVGGVGTAADTTDDEWDRVIGVNLTGLWRSCKAVLPAMVEASRGSIITQASIGALRGSQATAAYAASKAGVIGLTRQMAVDYGPFGIRVNAVAPGTVATELVREVWAAGAGMVAGHGETQAPVDAGRFAEKIAATAERYPLRRPGTPDDIANVALFLACDESAWVTGTVSVVDGGATAG